MFWGSWACVVEGNCWRRVVSSRGGLAAREGHGRGSWGRHGCEARRGVGIEFEGGWGLGEAVGGRYDGERIGRTGAGAGGVALLAGQVTRLVPSWYADDASGKRFTATQFQALQGAGSDTIWRARQGTGSGLGGGGRGRGGGWGGGCGGQLPLDCSSRGFTAVL